MEDRSLSRPVGGTGAWFDRRWPCLAVLAVAVLTVCGFDWQWLKAYRVMDLPPRWDEATYQTRAFVYYEAFASQRFKGFWKVFTDPFEPRPPLLPMSTMPLGLFGPYTPAYGQLTLFGYLALLALATYFIAEHLLGPPGGLFSALYLLLFPAAITYSRVMLSDLPTAALIALVVLCILKSDSYSRVGWNVAIGAALGLAMNARNFAGAYVLVPLLYALYSGVRTHGARVLLKLTFGILMNIVVVLPWYAYHLDALAGFFSKYTYGAYATIHLEHEVTDFFSTSANEIPPLFYLRALLFTAPSIYFGTVFLALLVLVLLRRRAVPEGGFPSGAIYLALWLLGSIAILSLISNVSLNYTLPLMPAVAISIELLSRRLGATRAVRVLSALPMVALSATYFGAAGGLEIGATLRQVYPQVDRGVPVNPDWKIRPILEMIARKEGNVPLRVGVVGSHPFFSSNAFRFEVSRMHLPCTITESLLGRDADLLPCVLSSDYLIIKDGLQMPSSAVVEPDRLRALFDESFLRYEQLPANFGLPDGAKAMVFRHLPRYQLVHTDELRHSPGARSFRGAASFLDGQIRTPLLVNFQNQIELLDASLAQRMGYWFETFSWHVLERPPPRIVAFAHFLDGAGGMLVQGDHTLGTDISTSNWRPGDFVTQSHFLRDFPRLSAVRTVGLGLWLGPGQGRLSVLSSTVPDDNEHTRVLLPASRILSSLLPELSEYPGTERVPPGGVAYADVFQLVSCRIDSSSPERPAIRYVWHCLSKPIDDYSVAVDFTTPDGKPAFQDDHAPLGGQFSTRYWRPGEWVIERRALEVPAGADTGRLDVRVGLKSTTVKGLCLPVSNSACATDWSGNRAVLSGSGAPR